MACFTFLILENGDVSTHLTGLLCGLSAATVYGDASSLTDAASARQVSKGPLLLWSHEQGAWNHQWLNQNTFPLTDLLWFFTEQVCKVSNILYNLNSPHLSSLTIQRIPYTVSQIGEANFHLGICFILSSSLELKLLHSWIFYSTFITSFLELL